MDHRNRIVFAAAIAFLLPNTQQITRRFEPALDFLPAANPGAPRFGVWLTWVPSRRWAMFLGVLAVASLLSLNRPNEFLYFQF